MLRYGLSMITWHHAGSVSFGLNKHISLIYILLTQTVIYHQAHIIILSWQATGTKPQKFQSAHPFLSAYVVIFWPYFSSQSWCATVIVHSIHHVANYQPTYIWRDTTTVQTLSFIPLHVGSYVCMCNDCAIAGYNVQLTLSYKCT